MKRALPLLVVALAWNGPADAAGMDARQDPARDQDAAGSALVAAFDLFCLRVFPDAGQVAAAAPGRVVALSTAEVGRYLHDDPGRGWSYRADGGTYVVTFEDPPFHTCAVRRMYAAAPRYRLPWNAATGRWAASQGRTFQAGQSQETRDGELAIAASGRALPGPGGGDMLLEIRTTYPDGQVEERLARRTFGR